MTSFELIFLFSLFSAETKSLPPVMDDSKSIFFCQKQNTFSRNICSSYSVSYKSKVWSWNVLTFSTIRLYCYRKQAWLSAFVFCNFIVELAVIHAILKNIWCIVLSYHMLHYFWYKQPFVFKLSNFCIGNRFIYSSYGCG